MKKYLKYIMILIIGLFIFNGIDVNANNNELCPDTFSLRGNEQTICSLKGRFKITVNGTTSIDVNPRTVNIKYLPDEGLWIIDSDTAGNVALKKIKEKSLTTLMKTYNQGSYKYNSSSFECPKDISGITVKDKKINTISFNNSSSFEQYASDRMRKFNINDSANSANSANSGVSLGTTTELLVDYVSAVKSYTEKKVKEIQNYKCDDSKVEKLETYIGKECGLDARMYCSSPIIVVFSGKDRKTECKASAAPLVSVLESEQKKIVDALNKKAEKCDCEKYTDPDKRKQCEENIDTLQKKAEEDTTETNNIAETVEEAESDYNFKKVILDEEDTTCEGMLSKEGTTFLKKVLKFIQYGGVIVALLSSTLDFIKAVSSGAQDDLKKSFNRFLKRMIFAALLFFVVLLTNLLLGIFNITVPGDCL